MSDVAICSTCSLQWPLPEPRGGRCSVCNLAVSVVSASHESALHFQSGVNFVQRMAQDIEKRASPLDRGSAAAEAAVLRLAEVEAAALVLAQVARPLKVSQRIIESQCAAEPAGHDQITPKAKRRPISNPCNPSNRKIEAYDPVSHQIHGRRRRDQISDAFPGLVLPKTSFEKVVRDIAGDLRGPGQEALRFEPGALMALQEAGEAFMVGVFADAALCTVHRRRVRMEPADLTLALRLRRDI